MAICAIVFLSCAAYLIHYYWNVHLQKQSAQEDAAQYVTVITVSSDTAASSSEEQESEAQSDDGTEETDEAEDDIYRPLYSIDFASLQSASDYVIGWIQVSGIDEINYPIVQYSDNSYFLTHAWNTTALSSGAIFVDTNCSSDFSDAYTLIYGHHMRSGTMFGQLKKYQEQSFYEENGGIVTIYLPTQTLVYQIFSVRIVAADDESAYTVGYTHSDSFEKYVQKMVSKSLYDTGVSVSAEDNVITLSTCSGTNRLVLHA